ncbi:unnamed protein product [Cylicocyclus nassatus]|uniref:Uncharacterized protein n=1 Tax=Cylicocyclus nassatus TaxID=53992 RepID=A0AA36DRT6_CYLNA|nr:unnamed protein product [Cylicocyclus nassatus]
MLLTLAVFALAQVIMSSKPLDEYNSQAVGGFMFYFLNNDRPSLDKEPVHEKKFQKIASVPIIVNNTAEITLEFADALASAASHDMMVKQQLDKIKDGKSLHYGCYDEPFGEGSTQLRITCNFKAGSKPDSSESDESEPQDKINIEAMGGFYLYFHRYDQGSFSKNPEHEEKFQKIASVSITVTDVYSITTDLGNALAGSSDMMVKQQLKEIKDGKSLHYGCYGQEIEEGDVKKHRVTCNFKAGKAKKPKKSE